MTSTTPAPETNDSMILFGMSVPDLYATGENIRWYSDRELTMLVEDTNRFATGQTEPGDYTYYATQTISGCVSDAGAATLSIVSEVPPPQGHDTAIDLGNPIILSVSGAQGAKFHWYDDPSLSTLLHTGAEFVPQLTDPGTYVYYVTQTLYQQESEVDTVILRHLGQISISFLRALIEEGVDTNGDSQINPEEAEAVTYLDISGYDITDMAGIEAFFNLDTLYCGGNIFTSLDLSSNAALRYLDCGGHLYLTVSPLQRLNLSGCTGLTYLDCSSSELNSLDLSGCTALDYLDCSFNHLTNLDLSANTRLEYLNCAANQLSCLNISNNTLIGSETEFKTKLDLGYMRSLTEVCVWTTPFPPTGLEINTSGSPDLYFTENCSGCSTGREEMLLPEISVFPNPAYEFITIRSAHMENMSVEITSSKGQLIARRIINGTTMQLDLSSVQKGVYLITINSKDFVTTKKIVKLNKVKSLV
ncbi:MAG: T9SS type A sorting domain-containing protein [Bacteroidales bacterium]